MVLTESAAPGSCETRCLILWYELHKPRIRVNAETGSLLPLIKYQPCFHRKHAKRKSRQMLLWVNTSCVILIEDYRNWFLHSY